MSTCKALALWLVCLYFMRPICHILGGNTYYYLTVVVSICGHFLIGFYMQRSHKILLLQDATAFSLIPWIKQPFLISNWVVWVNSETWRLPHAWTPNSPLCQIGCLLTSDNVQKLNTVTKRRLNSPPEKPFLTNN